MTHPDKPGNALTGLIRDMFGTLPAAVPVPPLTLADRLELITDTVTDVQATADANGATLEDIAGAVETNGNTQTDMLAVLEDIRDILTAIREQGASDEPSET